MFFLQLVLRIVLVKENEVAVCAGNADVRNRVAAGELAFGLTDTDDAHEAVVAGKPVLPDIMTLGKAVGGGLPIGIMFARSEIAALLTPGKHGCTLGANAICMAVCRTIFDVIEREKLVEHAAKLGEHGISRLRNESRIKDRIIEARRADVQHGE